MTFRRLAVFAVVLAVAAASAAQELEATKLAADIRIEARSVLMFNQHLYFGAFTRPRALAYDRAHDELWVADAASGRAGVYRTDGSEMYSFVSTQYLRDAARITISPQDELLVLSSDRTVIRRFNYRGEFKGNVALPATDHKRNIGAIAFDGDGNLYVGDNATAEVYVVTAEGKVKFEFGSKGRDEGQFMAFAGIVVSADGTIVVADQQALAVQLFDKQGNFIRGWGRHELGGGSNFSLPSGVALDSRGRIYVSDELRHQVKVFRPNGELLGIFGGLGEGPGQLSFPTDVAVDGKDRVFVCERFTARVQVFETRDVAAD